MTTKEKVIENATIAKIKNKMKDKGYGKEEIKEKATKVEQMRKKLVEEKKYDESYKVKKDFEMNLMLNRAVVILKLYEDTVNTANKTAQEVYTREFSSVLGSIISLAVDDGTQYKRDITGGNDIAKDASQYEFYKLSKVQMDDVTNNTINIVSYIEKLLRVTSTEYTLEIENARKEALAVVQELTKNESSSEDFHKDLCLEASYLVDKQLNEKDIPVLVGWALAVGIIEPNDLKVLAMTTVNMQGVLCSESTFARLCDKALEKAKEVISGLNINIDNLNEIHNVNLPKVDYSGSDYQTIIAVLQRIQKLLVNEFKVEASKKLLSLNSKRKLNEHTPAEILGSFVNMLTTSAMSGSSAGNDYAMTKHIDMETETIRRKAIIASIIYQLMMIRLLQEQEIVDALDIFAPSFTEEMTYELYEAMSEKIEKAIENIIIEETQEELQMYKDKFVVKEEPKEEKKEEAPNELSEQ